ncbi:uncharacterized protein LOC106460154 [Limulus polyphemus]|uniref:Uncharacterized protein LOC106460154 n=1 Tax=Limulus polyphemus TaxID=6850 RepID=A0ABM1B5L6_LIMPO|nr:uncharacterized protein LOC106460154 [Limulus polyphemus]
MEKFSFSETAGVWSLEQALFPDAMINVEESDFSDSDVLLKEVDSDFNKSTVSVPTNNQQSYPEIITEEQNVDDNDLQDWMDKNMDMSVLECLELQFDPLDDPLVKNGDPFALFTSLVDKTEIVNSNLNSSDDVIESFNSTKSINSSDTITGSANLYSEGIIGLSVNTCTPPESPVGKVPDISSVLGSVSNNGDTSPVVENSSDSSCEVSNNTKNSFASFQISSEDEAFSILESIISSSTDLPFDLKYSLETSVNSDASPVSNSDFVELENELSGDIEVKQSRITPYGTAPSALEKPSSRIKSVTGSVVKGTFSDKRKERKKRQNKEAATRYREKKRAESMVLVDEEASLKKQNQELKEKVQQLSNEISYLKGLMELFKARYLKK